ncbi:hypothetical protein F5144DRAFT_550320 [Chaetomium tenue]|uniref:Uncharacterized protein n=1 Tax=Chaetomium tenue TaxID=1854479 RepID=A0ACB7NWJ8_9PEZI|nr:hypothetical protein F5144DRAFT_550320 [Chaetomium globosum]
MTPPSPGHGNAAKAAHLIKAAKELLLDAGIEDCVALVDENTRLKAEKETLGIDVNSRDRKIAELNHKMDIAKGQLDVADAQVGDLQKHVDGLTRKLKEAQEALKASHKDMASKEVALGKEIAMLKRNLDIEREELHDLKGFSVELMPVATSHKEISSKLNKIFLSARDMAETYFGDMPPQLRSNAAFWDNLKRHPAFRKDIPIPLSDTLVAKQMRMAAFLAFVAHEIRHNIFQPTYLLPDLGLARILDNLGDNDSDREAHFRSVLVRLADLSPSNTNAVIASHISAVMANVSEHIHNLIPEKSRPAFDVKFRNLCTEAAEQWKFIQRLDGKIDFDFSPDEANPLYIPTSTTNSEPGPSSNNSNSNNNNAKSRPNTNNPNKKSSSSNNNNNNNNTNNTNTNPPTTTDPNLLTDPLVIWPAFYNQSTDDQETLVPGFLLTAGQVAVAKAEEKTQLQQLQQQGQQVTTSQRRAQRQQTRSSRALSMSAGVGTGVGGVDVSIGEH